MWCILENKVPTWDKMQKRNMYGPGWCCLCKIAEESIIHLFMQCRFIAEVWKECSKMIGTHCISPGHGDFLMGPPKTICGGGALLFLSDDHFFKIAVGLGEGTNNYAEILSLKMLLVFAIEQSVKDLSIYGDSMNIINWTKGTQRCINLNLENILEDVLMLKSSFEYFSCHHIYRSQHQEADQESKKGLLLGTGQWKITEFQGAQTTNIIHAPFL